MGRVQGCPGKNGSKEMRMHLDLLDLHERFVEKVAQQLLIEIFNLAVLKRLKISFEFSQFVFPN